MLSYLIVLAVVALLFRKPLGKVFGRLFPDRQKRHRFVAMIIAALLLVIGLRIVGQMLA